MISLPTRTVLVCFSAAMSLVTIIASFAVAYAEVSPRLFLNLNIAVIAIIVVGLHLSPTNYNSSKNPRTIRFVNFFLLLCPILVLISFAASIFMKIGDPRVVIIGASISPLFVLMAIYGTKK